MENKKDNDRTFIVAEVGINHNGDMGLARELIIAAAEAGADSVKFQNYKAEDFIEDRNLFLDYKSQNNIMREPQYDIFKRCELNTDQLADLKNLCDSLGILFHSTPTNVDGINDLLEIGCTVLKNGSDYLTNLDLIRAMGETGLLTVISAGMATISEIDEAILTYRATGNDNLILLHCTSSYPVQPNDVNLNRIKTLRDVFDVEVGFSDHSIGTTAAIGAVIMGACWIEKHFTLDKGLAGPDHWFSADCKEFSELVMAIRDAEQMTGSPRVTFSKTEAEGRFNFRLSCVAAKNISQGEIITREHIAFKRPGNGFPPKVAKDFEGLIALRNIKKGEHLSFNLFKGNLS